MQNSEPPVCDIVQLASLTRAGGRDPRIMARNAIDAIRRVDEGPDGLNAFISFDQATSTAAAEAVAERIAAGGDPGRLAGVPVAVKDNICTLGLPTTCASRLLEGYVSPFEATVVRRLRREGAVLVGKTNMDEFGMGSSTEHSAFGPTRNPHDTTRVPGGSSGGSAAAVAAGIVPAALGSDTGGSVRQPAALCGVVGIKPSYGRVSRYGLIAFASSLDQIGTFGRTVRDAATLLEAISGPDPLDSTAADMPVPDLLAAADQGPRGLVVGVPREYFTPDLDRSIARLCAAAMQRLAAAGAEIRQVSLPNARLAIPTYYIVAPAEASSNLARFDGVHFGKRAPGARTTLQVYESSRSAGLGNEVKRRIMLGTYVLSAGYREQYYARAQRVRALISADIRRVFDDGVHVLFSPTTQTPAARFGEMIADPVQTYLADVFTVTANLAGIPAISVPIGKVNGLPVGGQFMAQRWREDTLVRAAAALETALTD